MDKYKEEIGKNIKFWLKLYNLKYKDFAEKVDVSQTYISQIIGGKQSISIKKLSEIAEALNIGLEDIVANQPYQDIVYEMYQNEALEITHEELKDLLSIRIKTKQPDKNFFMLLLDMMRNDSVFFKQNK